MNDNVTLVELLFQKVESYSNTTLEILQLKAIEKSADLISSFVAQIAIIAVALLATFAINIGIALWIGKLLGNSFYGFYVVGLFYTIVALLLYTFKNSWIKGPLHNSLISQMMKQKNA
jgi:hypothetical protein